MSIDSMVGLQRIQSTFDQLGSPGGPRATSTSNELFAKLVDALRAQEDAKKIGCDPKRLQEILHDSKIRLRDYLGLDRVANRDVEIYSMNSNTVVCSPDLSTFGVVQTNARSSPGSQKPNPYVPRRIH